MRNLLPSRALPAGGAGVTTASRSLSSVRLSGRNGVASFGSPVAISLMGYPAGALSIHCHALPRPVQEEARLHPDAGAEEWPAPEVEGPDVRDPEARREQPALQL